jgi:hypothetical protein
MNNLKMIKVCGFNPYSGWRTARKNQANLLRDMVAMPRYELGTPAL